MNKILRNGLLALTIAFGITSCDKNDVGSENLQMTQSEVKAGLASKVTFSENGTGIVIPKLKGATVSAAKTASEFSHIYSSTPQTLIISDAVGAQYTGSYTAGVISTLDPASIILSNGNGYSALSSNASNQSEAVVLGFLPYTSAASFDLSAAASIRLQATLERGFLIVNAQAEAADGNRVSGATANGAALIGPDDEGDFYGYLLAGDHDIVVTYMLDDTATEVRASQDVAIGVAYTIELDLDDDAPAIIGSDVSTSTATALESAIGQEAAGRDINEDGDLLDSLERIITTTTPTLDGEPNGPGVPSDGPWYVVSDVDITTDVEESTEDAITTNINPDVDSDQYDTISRILTITTTYDADGIEVSSVSVPGVWTILDDRSSLGVDEDLNNPGDAVPDTADEYISSAAPAVESGGESSSNDPAFGAWVVVEAPSTQAITSRSRSRVVRTDITARISTIVTSYTVMINGVEDVPALVAKSDTSVVSTLAEASFSDETETETEDNFPNPAYAIDVADEFIYSAFVGEGSAPAATIVLGTPGTVLSVAGSEVAMVTATTTTPRWNVVAAYSYDQTRTVSVQVNVREDSPALDVANADSLTQTINVDEDRSAHTDLVTTEQVANPDYNAPSEGFTATEGSVTISGLFGLQNVKLGEDLISGASADGEVVTFTAAVAGSYTVNYFASSVAFAFNQVSSATVVVAEDGSFTAN